MNRKNYQNPATTLHEVTPQPVLLIASNPVDDAIRREVGLRQYKARQAEQEACQAEDEAGAREDRNF